MSNSSDKSLKAITVRIPGSLYQKLKEHAASHKVSLNSIVADAIAKYGTKLERSRTITDILDFQQRLRRGKGKGTDSVEHLRTIRRARSMQGYLGNDEADFTRLGSFSSEHLSNMESTTRTCDSERIVPNKHDPEDESQ